MSSSIRLIEPLGERTAALPLDLGGAGSTLVVPGAVGHALTLTATGRQWLVQPAAAAESGGASRAAAGASLNGMPLRNAQPLADGDVIALGEAHITVHPSDARIDVAHLAGNITVAPLRQQALPGDEVVAGVREILATGTPARAASPVAARAPRLRWIGMAAAAAVLVAAVSLLFLMVPVPLQVTPAEARLHVPGLLDWQSEGRVFMLPGRREIDISHPGYRSRTVTLQVTRDLADATPLPVTLEYLPGVIAVDTGGVAAEVLVEGRVAGQAPGDVEIESGPRTLVLRAPGHVDHVASLVVAGGGQRQPLQVAMQPSVGSLLIDTQPTGAAIRIDGEPRGDAPLRLELEAGLHQLTLSAPGRRAWSSEIAIIAGQTLDLGRVDLALPPAVAVRAATTSPTTAAEDAPSADEAPAQAAAPAAPRPAPAPRLQSALLGELVLFPAGEYQQGSGRREQGRRSNEVLRTVQLTRPFYLAATEVSNAQFRAFRDGHISGVAMDKSLDLDTQAVSNVTWDDAVEFCNWLSLREGLPAAYERRDGRWQLVQPLNHGYRLPTEAEWEYALRYVDGARWQNHAWGDALPPPAGAANLGGEEIVPPRKSGAGGAQVTSLPQYRDEHPVVAPVGSYARSAAGLFDMGGNVSEWMHDVYESLPASGPVTDPMGPAGDGPHAIRGANWRTTALPDLRAAWRERGAARSQSIGFRVARFAMEPP